jgi:uncharacterized integral membrane protein (TIGR00698 family)
MNAIPGIRMTSRCYSQFSILVKNGRTSKYNTCSTLPSLLHHQQWEGKLPFVFSSGRHFSSPSLEKDTDHQDDQVVVKKTMKKQQVAAAQSASTSAIILPGIAFSAATATVGFTLADILSTASGIPISGIPLAIITGMAFNNIPTTTTTSSSTSSSVFKFLLPDPSMIRPGVQFSTKTILQAGIVAVAAKLSFVELITMGSAGLPVVLVSVGAGLTLIPMYGNWAGLPKEMSLLLTAGTSICGVTAITALAPAIQASNRDIAVAVANTVAFGTMGMLMYPYLFHSICSSSEQVGMCLGIGIHDTSQVLGAAMSYKETFHDEMALKVAAITKLTRNLGLAVAIPGLTYAHAMTQLQKHQHHQQQPSESIPSTMSGLNTFSKYVPPFLIAFVGMSCLRSTGDMLLGTSYAITTNDLESFQHVMNFIGNDVSKYALGTAMAGVGLSTSVSSLQGVGWKPFAVGAAGALTVGGTGFAVASMMV